MTIIFLYDAHTRLSPLVFKMKTSIQCKKQGALPSLVEFSSLALLLVRHTAQIPPRFSCPWFLQLRSSKPWQSIHESIVFLYGFCGFVWQAWRGISLHVQIDEVCKQGENRKGAQGCLSLSLALRAVALLLQSKLNPPPPFIVNCIFNDNRLCY